MVLAIFGIMIMATTPFLVKFQHTQKVGSLAEDLAFSLRKAQHRALVAEQDSAWGVALLPTQLVVFSGDSYASRITRWDSGLSFSSTEYTLSSAPSLTEIVYQKGSGLPLRTGTITVIHSSGYVRQVSVGSGGLISLQ